MREQKNKKNTQKITSYKKYERAEFVMEKEKKLTINITASSLSRNSQCLP